LGLVYARLQLVGRLQSAFVASQASIANDRRPEKRASPGPRRALTRTVEIVCAPPRPTVTEAPATSGTRARSDHCVFSSASISPPWLVPSPDVVAPFADEAQLRRSGSETVVVWPAANVFVRRVCPYPCARTKNSYVPATNFAVAPSVVVESVSAIGTARAWKRPAYTAASTCVPVSCATVSNVTVAFDSAGDSKLGVAS